MSRREVDIGTAKFGVEFENNVGTILTFWISNVFHLTVSTDEIREYLIALRGDPKDSVGDTLNLTIQSSLQVR